MMSEKEIERLFVDAIKDAGGIAYKFTSPGNSGVPDRIVCLPDGQTIFVELKTTTGRLTALQERQIDRLHKAGQSTAVLYGLRDVIDFLEYYDMPEQAERLARRYDL